ncbi:MAG: hypothetical protein ABEH47_05665 [Haloferacaceae archaeon]
MDELTRRRLLAAAAAGVTGSLSGCSDSSDAGGSTPGGGSGGDSTPTPTPTPTNTTNATTTAPGPEARYPEFAALTARIADGIVWHATQWQPTMRQVRNLAFRVTGLADDLLSTDTVTENDIAELERRTTAFAEHLRENVVPHYQVEDVLLNGNNVYIQQLKLASRRGDTSGQRQQLQRIKGKYENYTRSSFLESVFRNGPIHAKLYEDMVAGKGTVFGLFHPASGFVEVAHADEAPKDDSRDGVPQHVHEFNTGHVVVAHTHAHNAAHNLGEHSNEPPDRRLYAYRNGQFDVLRDTNLDTRSFNAYEPELTNVFGAVTLPDRHEEMVYATVNGRTADFTELPLQIQRFGSPRAAADAVEFLLSADVFDEGTETVGGREWRRVFYTQQETNVYAFLLRTGAYVITLFPEAVPWGDRVDWPGPFKGTWITGGG